MVYRDDHAVAFFPLRPATFGHTLVVPRLHIPDIWELPEADAMGPIWQARPPSHPPQALDNLRDKLADLMAA